MTRRQPTQALLLIACGLALHCDPVPRTARPAAAPSTAEAPAADAAAARAGTTTGAEPGVPRQAASTPAPSGEGSGFDFAALLERERPALEPVEVADPRGRWRSRIEARLPATIEDRGRVISVRVDVGTSGEVRCEVHEGQVNPGAAITSVIAAASGNIALEQVQIYHAASVDDVPLVAASAEYRTRSTPPLAGELKIAVSPRAPFSVVCLQDEPGYHAAFVRGVEGFVKSMESEARPSPAQYSALWQLRVGEMLTGYRWDRVYAEPDGRMAAFSFNLFLAQLASRELRITDGMVATVHDRQGVVSGNFLSYRGTQKQHEIELRRAASGRYTYRGERDGKALQGSFTAKGPVTGRYELLLDLLEPRTAGEAVTLVREEYRPDTNATALTPVSYTLSPDRSELRIQSEPERGTWALRGGLPSSSRLTMGPNTFIGTVVEQRNSLGTEPGVTVGAKPAPPAGQAPRLAERRRGVETQIFVEAQSTPAPTPPPVLSKVLYTAPLGPQVAYASPPQPGPKRPGLIWLGGTLDFSIGEAAWKGGAAKGELSPAAVRDAGVVLMRPALRGANENPGRAECFFGEVEDVIAAADYLSARADVDAGRLYVGGQGPGATLALLVAAATDRFRGAFAFGPVADVRQYGLAEQGGCLPEGAAESELTLRAPLEFVSSIRTPTFVFEAGKPGARAAFEALRENASQHVHFQVAPALDAKGLLEAGARALSRAIAAGRVDDSALLLGR